MQAAKSRSPHRPANRLRRLPPASISPPARTARVIGRGPNGEILVQGGEAEPVPARWLHPLRAEDFFDAEGQGREVLLVLDGGQESRPIIVGILQPESGPGPVSCGPADSANGRPGTKERLTLEALAELVLKCGAGSITLRKDGKIVLRGTHLLSRASGPIRIKGGHVEIN